jgi:hypothetical protein
LPSPVSAKYRNRPSSRRSLKRASRKFITEGPWEYHTQCNSSRGGTDNFANAASAASHTCR